MVPHTQHQKEEIQPPIEHASPSTSESSLTYPVQLLYPHHKAPVAQIQILVIAPVTSQQFQPQVTANCDHMYLSIITKPCWRSYTVTYKSEPST